MIERFGALFRGSDEYLQPFLEIRLPNIFAEQARPKL